MDCKKCNVQMEIISDDRDAWTVFKCPKCNEVREEPCFTPDECVKCEIPMGAVIGCSDCGHYYKRQAAHEANEAFWKEHRADLRARGVKIGKMEFVEVEPEI